MEHPMTRPDLALASTTSWPAAAPKSRTSSRTRRSSFRHRLTRTRSSRNVDWTARSRFVPAIRAPEAVAARPPPQGGPPSASRRRCRPADPGSLGKGHHASGRRSGDDRGAQGGAELFLVASAAARPRTLGHGRATPACLQFC